MTPFDWNQALSFLVTAEEGSFSAAARALGLTQPTLSRQVGALEQALGVTLFERTGRSLALTEAGLDLLEHVRTMRAAADQLSLGATGKSQSVTGKVTVSASDSQCAYILPRVLEALRQAAPRIVVEINAENEISDLIRRQADIALRHVRPEQPDLIARRLPDGKATLYAHADYLRQIGWRGDPADLKRATLIAIAPAERTAALWQALGAEVGADDFRYLSNSAVTTWEMARQGRGICLMSQDIADLSDAMVPVLPDRPPLPFENWLVTHRELNTSRRIRLVFDCLAAALGRKGDATG